MINPIEIKIDEDKFLKKLQKYLNKNYKHRFLVEELYLAVELQTKPVIV